MIQTSQHSMHEPIVSTGLVPPQQADVAENPDDDQKKSVELSSVNKRLCKQMVSSEEKENVHCSS